MGEGIVQFEDDYCGCGEILMHHEKNTCDNCYDKDQGGLCAKLKVARDLWETEEEKGIGHSHSTIYARIGCFDCLGGLEMANKCSHYRVKDQYDL